MDSQLEIVKNTHTSAEKPTICLVHGAWHGAWCWDLLRPELENLGHRTIAPNLPIDQTANFDEYAELVAAELAKDTAEEVVLVGHSMAGNVITRVPGLLTSDLGKVAVTKNIYLAASIDERTIGWLPPKDLEDLPEKNTLMYKIGTEGLEGDNTKFNKEFAKDVFYMDCSEEDAEWAVSMLRRQLRSTDQTVIQKQPDVPSAYIKTTRDLVFTRNWQNLVAGWLGIPSAEVHDIYSGHCPMLSRVEKLAPILSRFATSTHYKRSLIC